MEEVWGGRPARHFRGQSEAENWRPIAFSYFASSGSIKTNLPIEPRSLNTMRPLILAKSVSSLPRPTFSPGFTLVPRWRTMMVPPGTSCPPKAFTPSRCALESRPFLELPKPFLCAIVLCDYLVHPQFGEMLAVPDCALVLFLALKLENGYLLGAVVSGD